jgi:hypothetical protein
VPTSDHANDLPVSPRGASSPPGSEPKLQRACRALLLAATALAGPATGGGGGADITPSASLPQVVVNPGDAKVDIIEPMTGSMAPGLVTPGATGCDTGISRDGATAVALTHPLGGSAVLVSDDVGEYAKGEHVAGAVATGISVDGSVASATSVDISTVSSDRHGENHVGEDGLIRPVAAENVGTVNYQVHQPCSPCGRYKPAVRRLTEFRDGALVEAESGGSGLAAAPHGIRRIGGDGVPVRRRRNLGWRHRSATHGAARRQAGRVGGSNRRPLQGGLRRSSWFAGAELARHWAGCLLIGGPESNARDPNGST